MEDELKKSIDKLLDLTPLMPRNEAALCGIVRDLIIRVELQNKAQQGTMALMFRKIQALENRE